MVALGIIAGVIIMLGAYAFSMFGYFKLRQAKSSSKFIVEIIALAFAVLVSITIKFIIIFQTSGLNGIPTNDFWVSMEKAFTAIYSGIGGFTFEGLSDFEDGISAFLKCLYAGSSLYAGIMVLSVLTAKVSYEIYSGIRMFFNFKRKMRAGKTDFYIFSAVTEESLTLANSINTHHKNSTRGCVIIFTGNGLEAFDGKNELHREIMANGYYYWSYSNKSQNERGVFARLGLPVYMDFFKVKQLTAEQECKIHFFAMDTNEKLSGLESVNSSTVFSEIAILARKLVAETSVEENNQTVKKYSFAKTSVINFYILADNEINYEFYKRETEGILAEALKDYDSSALLRDIKEAFGIKAEKRKTDLENAVKVLSSYFQIALINEADLAGKCLAKQRQAVLLEGAVGDTKEQKTLNGIDRFVKNSLPNKEGNYRVMVLGFGINGQQSMKHLYHATAYVNEEEIPSRFVADVYDPQSSSSAGLFEFKHPMFTCVDKKNTIEPVTEEEWSKEKRFDVIYSNDTVEDYAKKIIKDIDDDLVKIKEKYKDDKEKQEYLKQYESWGVNYKKSVPHTFEEVEKYLKLPVVAFHKVSAFEDAFVKFLDKKTGESSTKEHYKAFIIALGDDERNILMANSLISDIMCERASSGKTIDSTIYVNIRDKKNYQRINWTEVNSLMASEVKVVVYGASEDMFSYDMIIDDSDAMKYNYAYSCLEGQISNDLREYIMGLSNKSAKDLVEMAISPEKYVNDYRTMREKWMLIDTFKKQSNYATSIFSNYYWACYRLALLNGTEIDNEEINRLSAVEHERWNRFHISNGWFFDVNRCDQLKMHSDLCAYNSLPVSTKLYDVINVITGMGKRIDN